MLFVTKIPCGSIKHISIDQSGPGLCDGLQKDFVIRSKLLSHGQKLRVSLEVMVNFVHQEIGAYSLAKGIINHSLIFSTFNIFLLGVRTSERSHL